MAKSNNTKYILFGGGIAALLGIAVVLVMQEEGRKTREAMNSGLSSASKDVGDQASQAIDRAGKDASDKTRDEIRQAKDEIKESAKDQVKDAVRETVDDVIKDGTGGLLGGDGLGGILGGGRDKKDGKGSSDIDPQGVVGSVIDFGNTVLRTADDIGQETFALSLEEEKKYGAQLHELMLKDNKTMKSPSQLKRVVDLARPILERRKRKDLEFKFTLLNDDGINAASLPGGYIYIFKGLLDFVENDEQLQFVIGHEIGHVDLKHCTRALTYSIRGAELTGGAAQVPIQEIYQRYQLAYSEDLELEADEYSYIAMRKTDRSRDEALSYTRRMVAYLKEKGIEDKDDKPGSIPDAILQAFTGHFRTHPPSSERLERLEAIKVPGIDTPAEKPDSPAKVTGRVTLDGKPFPGARVRFFADQRSAGEGKTDADGDYTIKPDKGKSDKGIVPGTYRVVIVGKQIPTRYSDSKKTKLRAEVKDGENQIDFELSSG